MSLTVQTLKSVDHKQAVILSYRHIYRTVLQTVRYSVPSRYILRRSIRLAFRDGKAEEFDPQRIVNTISFIQRAAYPRTMEKKILKTMTMVRYWQQPFVLATDSAAWRGALRLHPKLRNKPIQQYEKTLKLLNESLGLCLR